MRDTVLGGRLRGKPRKVHINSWEAVYFAHDLAGRAHDHRAIGNDLVLGNERVGADQAVLPDLRAVENDRADADQRAVADLAAVQHDEMADRDVLSDRERIVDIGVKDRAVLNVGPLPYDDGIVVAAHGGAEPDAGILVHDDAADDGSAVGHPAVGVTFGLHAVEFVDCHSITPGRRCLLLSHITVKSQPRCYLRGTVSL